MGLFIGDRAGYVVMDLAACIGIQLTKMCHPFDGVVNKSQRYY